MMKEYCYLWDIDEERALFKMTRHKGEIRDRVFKLNSTYNFLTGNVRSMYKIVYKPIKIAHFHPDRARPKFGVERSMDFYKGNNKIGKQLITDKLIEIFANYGIK